MMRVMEALKRLKRSVRRGRVWFFRKRLMQNASDIRISVREIIDCVMNDKDFTWTMYVIGERRGVRAMKGEYATHRLILMAKDRHIAIEKHRFSRERRVQLDQLNHRLYRGIVTS